MNMLSVPVLVMAGIVFYVGFFHLFIYFRRIKRREDLVFALMCFTIGFYDIFCALLYNASMPVDGEVWQFAQFAALSFAGAALVAFVKEYTAGRCSFLCRALFCYYIVNGIGFFAGYPHLWITHTPLIKHIVLPFGFHVTYYEMVIGPLGHVESIAGIVLFLYVFIAACGQYRNGQTNRARPLLWAMAVLFLGIVNDAAVSSGLYPSIYLLEYAYLGMVLLMAHSISNTIVESVAIKQALHESEEKYHLLFQSSNDAIVAIDVQAMMIVDYNDRYCQMSGHTADDVRGTSVLDLFATGRVPYTKEYAASLMNRIITSSGHAHVFEWQSRGKEGLFQWVEVSARVVVLGGRQVVLATVRDITDRKKNQEQIESSLAEKKLLLREIHHRVKNNLQIISSIINLQKSCIKDAQVASMMDELQMRVRSMSAIHESLYRSRELSRIDFNDYLHMMANDLLCVYSRTSGAIKIDVRAQNIFLSLDTAIPCGFLVNELVSNALKHAFPDGRRGVIVISLMFDEMMKKYRLAVQDNGIGLPSDYEARKSSSLGLILVGALVAQLSGTLAIDRTNGTAFIVTFKSA